MYSFNQSRIYLFCETWLDDTVLDSSLNFSNNFTVYRLDRTYAKHGGGLLILVPNQFKSKLCPTLTVCTETFETLSIQLFFEQTAITISVCYRPPHHTNPEDSGFQNFAKTINQISTLGQDCFIFGDFNLPGIDWSTGISNSGLSKAFYKLMCQNGLSQQILSPTRGKNILDLFFVSNENLISNSTTSVNFGTSDHKSLLITSAISLNLQHKKDKFRNFKLANWKEMDKFLLDVKWPDIFYNCSNADAMVNKFNNVISELIDICVPFCWKNHRSKVIPCFNNRLYRLRRIEQRLRKKHAENPNLRRYDRLITISKQIRAFNSLSATKVEEKILFSKDPKRFWAYVNKKIKSKPTYPVMLSKDGSDILEDLDKATHFADFYSSVFTLDDGINITNFPPTDKTLKVKDKEKEEKILRIPFFTSYQVLSYLKKLPSKNSSGLDGIPNFFLKHLAVALAEPLASIFNVSLFHSGFPQAWKEALIVPIPKKGQSSNISDYRPISLNSTVSKVMEKIVRDHILLFCRSNNLITSTQYGFLPGRSVEIQLLSCINKWSKNLALKITTEVLYLDLSKAFDTVSHKKLLAKLPTFGLPPFLVNWFSSYLSDRGFQVKINKSVSTRRSVTSGVPQGSVLGPLLFILYINDLPTVVNKSDVAIYADDIKLFLPMRSDEDERCFQDDINSVITWTDKNQLTISKNKCCLLRIGEGNMVDFKIENEKIPRSSVFRDLGVQIDSRLTFEPHINTIVKKASAFQNCLRRAFRTNNQKFYLDMYKTFVRPKLEFCTSIWHPSKISLATQVESVQRNFTKYVGNLYDVPYLERCETLHIESLIFRRVVNDLTNYFRIINQDFYDIDQRDFFSFPPTAQTHRGHRFKIYKSHETNPIRSNFFSLRLFDLWNGLPTNVIMSKNATEFKKSLHKNCSPKIRSFVEGHFRSSVV